MTTKFCAGPLVKGVEFGNGFAKRAISSGLENVRHELILLCYSLRIQRSIISLGAFWLRTDLAQSFLGGLGGSDGGAESADGK